MTGPIVFDDERQHRAFLYVADRMNFPPDGTAVERLAQSYIGRDEKRVERNEKKQPEGAKELGAEEFEKFAHTCPKCGFEFDG